ncbi:MAG: response regulator [Elainellaceae cyanobacterium]
MVKGAITEARRLAYHNLMVVEDNTQDAVLLERAFKKAELHNPVHVLSTGEEAVDYLAGVGRYSDRTQYPLPILIFLDLHLPARSGLSVLEWLRSQPNISRIPVIVLTGSKNSDDVRKAYSLGANSYMVKPTDYSSLTRMVEASKRYWLTLNVYPSVSPFPLRF